MSVLAAAVDRLRADSTRIAGDVAARAREGAGTVEPAAQRTAVAVRGFMDVFRGGTHPENLGVRALADARNLIAPTGGTTGPHGGTVPVLGSVTQPGPGASVNAAQAQVGAAGTARKA